MTETSPTEHVDRRDPAEVVADDERLSAVQDRIDEAKDAAGDLREDDVLAPGDGTGPADSDDDHGTFEPSGDGTDAGRNPTEGADAATPGAADDPRGPEAFDGPGPNPL